MKKILGVLLVCTVLLMSGCSQDIGIIGGADGPTAILVTGGEEKEEQTLPVRVEHEYTTNNDEFCTYYMTLRAFDENGALMWEYVTPDSMIAQCESLEYLGMKNGLVYVNESCLIDEEERRNGIYEERWRLRALNASDGTVAWDNTDYSGTGSSCAFDDAGNIYLAGYFGPDCIKIDRSGKTAWIVPCVDEDLYWAYDIALENDVLTITYEMNENGEGDTRSLSVDGKILG